MKKLLVIPLLMLIAIPILSVAQQAQETQEQIIIRYIAQEHQNTKDFFKEEMKKQLEVDHSEIQKQIDDNKNIIFQQFNSTLKKFAFRLSILWFATTFSALLLYRLVMMRITRKYRHVKFRDETLG